ncbi:MAG: transposase, partial [Syntrophales bacterium]|nr:transposase [Syntrophales bacterium]
IGGRVRSIFEEIALNHGFEINTMGLADDRVDIFLSFPPRYSISKAVGIMKSVSAGVVFHEHPEVKKHLFTHLFDTFPVYHLSAF